MLSDNCRCVNTGKHFRILVCYLNLPDMPGYEVKRRSKDRIIYTWDGFKDTVESLHPSEKNRYKIHDDVFTIYETTCITGLNFDLLDWKDLTGVNHSGVFDELYLARWFFNWHTMKYELKVLKLYEHMTAVDKDIRFAHNLSRLTTGHLFDTALERSKERLELLERKWKIKK